MNKEAPPYLRSFFIVSLVIILIQKREL